MAHLVDPLVLGARTAPSRVMFGPHVTNLGDDERRLTSRHAAYYERRAAGGAGVIVVEGASVHPSDWPYERAPLADRCGPGWAAIAAACHAQGALVVASLDHAGGQGSSAYSQAPLWAPSRVPEVNTREVPKWMEADDIAAVIAGFGAATTMAVDAGCDGVEINAGQHSLVRQFLSGLTNHRGDEWGTDRLLFARRVIDVVRTAARGAIVGLRLSCDELAPWAGITPEMAPTIAAELAACGLDYVVVTRGAIFSAEKTRPDAHEPTGFNIDVCRAVKAAAGATPVFLQGSVVDWGQAEWAIGDGVCDGVEMTRAQIADPSLVAHVRADAAHLIRPCIRCNQRCQVRDARNPIVSCTVEPSAGYESSDPHWYAPTSHPRDVTVVGGGVAGLEAARTAALRGHRVQVLERSDSFGGVTAVIGPGRAFAAWLVAECTRLGVQLRSGHDGIDATGVVVEAIGSVPGERPFDAEPGALVLDVLDVRTGAVTMPAEGQIALFDPIGGPIAVALAEELGERAVLITHDNIAGNELSRTGDLAPANVRLAQRGVQVVKRAVLRRVTAEGITVQDRFSGEVRTIACVAVVDCGFRLPAPPLVADARRVGDCVAPRTIAEAVLEARRVAASI